MSLIIIGKRGFIAKSLTKYFKKKNIKYLNISIHDFLKLENQKLGKYKNLINCSINKNMIKKKYNHIYDFDKSIANKISNFDIRYIFLSSRKVYGNNLYPNEKSQLQPKCFYSKNKVKAENICKYILGKKIIILRISNLIGHREFSENRLHNTFIDNFRLNLNKKKFFFNFDDYKDFLSIDQFCKIVDKICKNKKLHGIFNVSLGQKVYLTDLIKTLIKFSKKKILIIDKKTKKTDNFVLNNNKLLKHLGLKQIRYQKLIKYCETLGKKICS